MTTLIKMMCVLACAGCGTTWHVSNWNAVTITMPREQVHSLIGKPSVVLSRQQWDSTVRKPGNSLTAEGVLVLSSSMICQFETVEMWQVAKDQHDCLRVYFGKTGKVLGKSPYRIEDRGSGQPTSGSDVATRVAPEK